MKRFLNRPLIALAVVALLAAAFFLLYRQPRPLPPGATPTPTASVVPSPSPTAEPTPTPMLLSYALPVAEFRERATKKQFGTYVTPADSPVQPERFSGYHTGVDVEYGDIATDVPIYAMTDATVVQARTVSGYGGLLVLRGKVDGKQVYLLYGHVRLSSVPAVASIVKKGDRIGVLGTAGPETDGERKHLHFSIYTGSPVDIRGYVATKEALTSWLDPLTVLGLGQ